ncbi:hypothetical protein KUF71_001012, partial [Frankliniella fusca]
MGTTIKTSSPHYPRSNGLAEKGVHIVKGEGHLTFSNQFVKKCADSGDNFLCAHMEYNNTPLSGTDVAPSQVLMSRLCRTGVPLLASKLQQKITDIKRILKRKQETMVNWQNKRAKKSSVSYKEGDNIVIRKENKWDKGVVAGRHQQAYSVPMRGSFLEPWFILSRRRL